MTSILLGRCQRLERCGFPDCVCDIDPTDRDALERHLMKLKVKEIMEMSDEDVLKDTKPSDIEATRAAAMRAIEIANKDKRS